VELNAILYRNERTLQRLHTRLAAMERGASAGVDTGADAGAAAEAAAAAAAAVAAAAAAVAAAARYEVAAAARLAAIDSWLWNDASGCWCDLLWAEGEQLPQVSSVSK
tara:strand:+ start:1393 stop:1716 length:324 start_codon:yes stop_codon:yes gene_type:complete